MTDEFRDSKRFVTWDELQQEYAKRTAIKQARIKKAFRVFAYIWIATTLGVLSLIIYNAFK
jgi:hypothetical protein